MFFLMCARAPLMTIRSGHRYFTAAALRVRSFRGSCGRHAIRIAAIMARGFAIFLPAISNAVLRKSGECGRNCNPSYVPPESKSSVLSAINPYRDNNATSAVKINSLRHANELGVGASDRMRVPPPPAIARRIAGRDPPPTRIFLVGHTSRFHRMRFNPRTAIRGRGFKCGRAVV